jgi:hypothetical protein
VLLQWSSPTFVVPPQQYIFDTKAYVIELWQRTNPQHAILVDHSRSILTRTKITPQQAHSEQNHRLSNLVPIIVVVDEHDYTTGQGQRPTIPKEIIDIGIHERSTVVDLMRRRNTYPYIQ